MHSSMESELMLEAPPGGGAGAAAPALGCGIWNLAVACCLGDGAGGGLVQPFGASDSDSAATGGDAEFSRRSARRRRSLSIFLMCRYEWLGGVVRRCVWTWVGSWRGFGDARVGSVRR